MPRKPRGRTRTLPGAVRRLSLNPFDVSVARGIGHLLDTKGKFRRPELIRYVGLNPDLHRDVQRVNTSISKLRRAVKAYWDQWESSPEYHATYTKIRGDNDEFRLWVDHETIAHSLRDEYELNEEELRDFWVQSRMWDLLQDNLRAFDLYLPYCDAGWNMRRMNFWEWTVKRIKDGRVAGRILKNVLDDFVRFAMMLPSGESPKALKAVQEQVERALTDGTPFWHICEQCLTRGVETHFANQTELVRHINQVHPESLGGATPPEA